jgi:hypothetical protein
METWPRLEKLEVGEIVCKNANNSRNVRNKGQEMYLDKI